MWASCSSDNDCCNSSCNGGVCASYCAQVCSAGPPFTCMIPQGGESSVFIGNVTASGCMIRYETGGGSWSALINCNTDEVCESDGTSCVPATFGASSLNFNTSGLNLMNYFYPTGPNTCTRQ
jgi:hypothetical protein